jgi:hypothetical protein
VRGGPPTLSGWKQIERARPEEEVSFFVTLRHKNLEEFHRIFEQITDPESAMYGRLLESQQVLDLIAPGMFLLKISSNITQTALWCPNLWNGSRR